jgi:hypothetical protein
LFDRRGTVEWTTAGQRLVKPDLVRRATLALPKQGKLSPACRVVAEFEELVELLETRRSGSNNSGSDRVMLWPIEKVQTSQRPSGEPTDWRSQLAGQRTVVAGTLERTTLGE